MKYEFDYLALIQQMKDMAVLSVLNSMLPEDSKDTVLKSIEVFIRHGISAEEGLKIMAELGEVFKSNDNEKETK